MRMCQIHGLYLANEFAKVVDASMFPKTASYLQRLYQRPGFKSAYNLV